MFEWKYDSDICRKLDAIYTSDQANISMFEVFCITESF